MVMAMPTLEDAFPLHDSQYQDTDGDGWGDNETSGAHKPDHWPNDPSRNAGEATLECLPDRISRDSVTGADFQFTCTVTTSMSDGFTARIDLQSSTNFYAETSSQLMVFNTGSGPFQQKIFTGQALSEGSFTLVLTVTEPGADLPMDTASIRLNVYNSSVSSDVEDEFGWDTILDSTIFQIFAAMIVFVFLFGMLIIRGKARQVKDDEQRKTQAAQVLYNRMMSDQDVVQQRRVELGYDATPLPPEVK